VKTFEIKIIVWLFVSILMTLGALGFVGRAELQASSSETLESWTRSAATAPTEPTDASLQEARAPSAIEKSLPSPQTIAPPQHAPSGQPELALRPGFPSQDDGAEPKCPLSRVAMVRGNDSEASEGGGFYAARRNGIHGAVDLNGSVGETVHAVAKGQVVVASDWGKLGKTVILDHLNGGSTIYGHLNTIEVNWNSSITAGRIIGTIGYSGNAKNLQKKNLPPHLHFAYVRAFAGMGRGKEASLARIQHAKSVRNDFAEENVQVNVFHPIWAVGFRKCWEDPASIIPSSVSTRATP
jgi:murein DD-endopeptidase MepM/ murein hydrolase activator NlpD